jgi:hypothetical protein
MRILFLTLYYPPLNTIAVHRVKAFVDVFQQQGVTCDVITRYYDEEQQKGTDMHIGSHVSHGIHVPYYKEGNVIYTNFNPSNKALKVSKKIPAGLRGLYNYYKIDVYHYGWLQYVFEAFEKELKNNTYDFIIPSFGPPITLLAAKKLSEKFSIPVIADFRDIYIDERDRSGQLFLKKKVQHFLLKNTVGLNFATEGMKDYFLHHTKLKSIPSAVTYNGTSFTDSGTYNPKDEEVVNAFFELKKKQDVLLLYPGTLYTEQNITFFLDVLKKVNKEGTLKVGLLFLGWAENNLKADLNFDFISYLPRVAFQTSIYLQKNASALIWPVRDGYYTGFSGKLFEYIAAENIVILSPNSPQDINYFFERTKNIHAMNSKKELEQLLCDIHDGKIKTIPMEHKEILKREYWAEQFLNFIRIIKSNREKANE